MAAGFYSASLLQNQALALLQQQMIGQIFEGGDGLNSSIVDALLKPRATTGREIAAQALTGRIRTDAGMLRQASRNLSEAGSLTGVGSEGAQTLATSIDRMLAIAQEVKADPTKQTGLQDEFNSLKQTIAAKVSGTTYNGISLLDGSKWGPGKDDRVTPGANNTGSISIQAGETARPLTLYDMNAVSTAVSGLSLDPGDIDAAISGLSTQKKTSDMVAKSYQSAAAGFASDSRSSERQADILSVTAARAAAGAGRDPQSVLLNLLLGDQGKIFDFKG